MALKKPFIPVKVYRWLSADKKELITFDEEIIYQDFTVEDAVNRIGTYILNGKPNDAFYAWVTNKSLLFDIVDPKWSGYNINPFKATDYNSPQLDEPISYEYHTANLFAYKSINIVFASDLPKDLSKNKYYFSDLKTQTYKQYKKIDEKLDNLVNLNVKNVEVASQYFSRMNYSMKLSNVLLSQLFDNMHTSKLIDMIQWVDDSSRVLYKLYKTHKIKKEWFVSWTNVDKLTKINVVNLYSIVNRNGYCKISIDNTGLLLVNYVFDVRSYTKMKDISNHKQNIISSLENTLKQRIRLDELSLNAVARLEVHNSVFKALIKKIGEYIPIFHVIKSDVNKNKMSITCTYKRSSNYNQNTDIYDYIRSRIALGLSKAEIAEELTNLGIVGNIDEMIMGEMNMLSKESELKQKINLPNNGTIVVIQSYSTGYLVSVTNCPTYTEFEYLLYWLTKIVSTTANNNPPPVIKKDIQPKSPSKSPSIKSSSDSSVDQGQINFDDFDSFGGFTVTAGAHGKSSYLITMLQQADKELFGENYAREKCQNKFQPVVMSKNEKTKLEKNNQLHFDNIIEYGSSPNNMNYYACPRLWCPQSKVPLPADDPAAKCPIENEKPMEMFWDNDRTKKRYVKLIKPNEKGICVPCCMKKEPKADELKKCNGAINDDTKLILSDTKSPEITQEQDDEYYIMNQSAPIPQGRYGLIPEVLHNILFHKQNTTIDQCNKVIQKSQPCFVRKGIVNNRYDSITLAVTDMLNFKKKKDLISDIRKRLDIITFLSLNDGEICKHFMYMKALVPAKHPKLLKLFTNFKKSKLWNLSSGSLSRSLNIFYAYNRYIDYIAANDYHSEKIMKYIDSLIITLYGITPLVYEKIEKSSNEIHFHCPQLTTIDVDLNPEISIMIKEGKYYEPVELKARGTKSTVKTLKLNDYPMLQQVLSNCVTVRTDTKMYKALYALNNWIKSKVLKNSEQFTLKKILINSDLTITSMLTDCNILIYFEPLLLSLLPVILKEFGILASNVLFYDDLVGKKINVRVLQSDLGYFAAKCDEFDIKYDIGKVNEKTNDFQLNTTLYLQPWNITSRQIIHVNGDDGLSDFHMTLEDNHHRQKIWYSLQKLVANTILKKYNDDQLTKFHNMNRYERVQKLLDNFTNIPHKNKIKIILEELPTYSIAAVKNWLANIITNTKYDFMNNGIQETSNEFIFSQNAFVINGIKTIPDYMLTYHKSLPNESKTDVDDFNILLDADKPNDAPATDLPDMLIKGKIEKLGSKWIMHKKSKWVNMVYIRTDYDRQIMPQFVNWLSMKLGLKLTYADVEATTHQEYYATLDNKEAMFEILGDQSYFNSWLSISKRKLPTVQMFWDHYFSKLSKQERAKLLQQILDKNELYQTDIHIRSISKLFNISILTLHRGKYGKFDSKNGRGELQDLILSSTLYPAANNFEARPLIIFNKINEKKFSAYYLVVDKNMTIYMKMSEVPDNILILIKAHLSE